MGEPRYARRYFQIRGRFDNRVGPRVVFVARVVGGRWAEVIDQPERGRLAPDVLRRMSLRKIDEYWRPISGLLRWREPAHE